MIKKIIVALSLLPLLALFLLGTENVLASHCYQHCLDQDNTPAECSGLPTDCSGAGDGIFGEVKPPPGVKDFPGGGTLEDLPVFINNILKLLIVGAGIYSVFNLVLAGYAFMSAGDDPKKVQGAWTKIWQTLLGLAVAAGAFVLAAIFGKLLFDDFNALLQIRIFGPGGGE